MAQGILRAIFSASFLVMVIFTAIYLYWNTSLFYGIGAEEQQVIIGGYLITLALTLIVVGVYSPGSLKRMARANYWKQLGLKFIPSFLVTIVFLIAFAKVMGIKGSINPLVIVSYIPIGVLLVQLFVVTQIEELMNDAIYDSFQKRSGHKAANLVSMFVFAAFHGAKTGGNIAVMLIYLPLRYFWNYLKENGWPFLRDIPKIGYLFQATPDTNQNNAGSHFGWNVFILGFLQKFT